MFRACRHGRVDLSRANRKEEDMSNRKVEVAVNYGLAALVYFIVGSLIARLLRR